MSKRNPKTSSSSAAVKALEGLSGLILLEDVFNDPAGKALKRFLKWLAEDEKADVAKGLKRYAKLWQAAAEHQAFTPYPASGHAFQNLFLERLLEDANTFHRKAESTLLPQIPSALTKVYSKELETIQKILRTDWEMEFQKRSKLTEDEIPSFESGISQGTESAPWIKARQRVKEKLLNSKGAALISEVAKYFYQNGWGLFGRTRAFRWEVSRAGEGRLVGIDSADPIELKNLIGYDVARKALLENIEAFVAGKGANNVLIYGERGTGKSSTVKALLNAYQEKGLRLVEVHPSHLNEYHDILRLLKNRKEKFILFIDDLSFEENETSYKGLKALLEGAIEATPANVILIATSNRRHLIRESFDDRAGGIQKEGEIHGADTIEEKLSLSDRFGLVISFYSPDQPTYLKMVENWAKVEGIKMPAEELRLKALQWSRFNNGRSGRTARQFINDLKGKV
jgi:predicted AAA+ superfamily ATPase